MTLYGFCWLLVAAMIGWILGWLFGPIGLLVSFPLGGFVGYISSRSRR